MRRRQSSTSAGTRVLADRHAGAGGVEQADRFVRQLPGGDVAVRQPRRGFQRLVQHLHPVVLLQHRASPRSISTAFVFVGLLDLDRPGTGG